jgi:NADPH:quinone reductase-like Zn-dependent oxidoreductase
MKAIVQSAYGSPAGLELRNVDPPAVQDDAVLVSVRAAALHAGDGFIMKGAPYLVRFAVGWPRPKGHVPGFGLSGRVESVGRTVTELRPGDEVFAMCDRACAEFACVRQEHVVAMPANVTFEQAAAVPVSACAALHGLRDAGRLRPGQHVLINGASGGVGTFAVQIAKALGAEATGVCSTRNVELVRSIGADHVIDYTREDFTAGGPRYDLILDNVGNRSFEDCRRVLAPTGRIIPNTAHAGMGYILAALARSAFTRQQGRPFVSSPDRADLIFLKELIETGMVTPVIDRTYPLDETPQAIGYVAEGHARGKVVITI